jgi:hypothetical protein
MSAMSEAGTLEMKRLLAIILDEVEFLNIEGEPYAVCPVPGGYTSLAPDGKQHIAEGSETCSREVRSEFYAEWLALRYRAKYGKHVSTARAVAWSVSAALNCDMSSRDELPWSA